MNDSTRKTKIAEMATVLLAAHLGLPAAVISVDINGIDVFLGRQHVQVKVASYVGKQAPRAGLVNGRGSMDVQRRYARLTNNTGAPLSSGKYYGPRSKADLYVFVALRLEKPFKYEFWVATAAEVAHAKAGVNMRDEWRLEKRMDLFRGEAAA